MSECNHIWRVEGETLPNFPLEERVASLLGDRFDQFVWLRENEDGSKYELCPKCKKAVRNTSKITPTE